jgi:deoxyribonuclease-4
MRRAAQLAVHAVVFHPGAYTTSTAAEGLTRIVQGLDAVDRQLEHETIRCLLETTAGQGSNLGYRFEQLGEILARVSNRRRFGVCLDTCHLFAAGYALAAPQDYESTMQQLEQIIGLENVDAIHLNDSKHPLGSRKDRHEHIGEGEMGLEPFRNLLNDARFRTVPMYLETPKGTRDGQSWDRINLDTLRGLIA